MRVDFHNHVMPGVDDGAQGIDESCSALTCFEQDGVGAVITTPHVDASITRDGRELESRLGELDRGWQVLKQHADSHHPDLSVYRGVELMLDTPDPILADARLRLAGGPFILVEFPYMTVPPRAPEVLQQVRQLGVYPILAHPERYAGLSRDLQQPAEWRRHGALLQVNGPSLLGRYGREARYHAWSLLQAGLVSYLCSDYHSRGAPQVTDYYQILAELGAAEHASLLMEVNPRRILNQEEPLPVPPLKLKKTVWSQIGDFFRPR